MRRILLAMLWAVTLTACSTTPPDAPIQSKPAMQSEDFSKMGDDELCETSFTRVDPRIDKEIKKRDLYCDKADLICREEGYERNSLAMVDCLYNEKLQNQSPNVTACFDSGVDKNDVNGMTDCLLKKEGFHYGVPNTNYIYERK